MSILFSCKQPNSRIKKRGRNVPSKVSAEQPQPLSQPQLLPQPQPLPHPLPLLSSVPLPQPQQLKSRMRIMIHQQLPIPLLQFIIRTSCFSLSIRLIPCYAEQTKV